MIEDENSECFVVTLTQQALGEQEMRSEFRVARPAGSGGGYHSPHVARFLASNVDAAALNMVGVIRVPKNPSPSRDEYGNLSRQPSCGLRISVSE